MTERPSLAEQIAACADAAEHFEHAGEWDTSQWLAAAAETLRALVPRLIEEGPLGTDILLRDRAGNLGVVQISVEDNCPPEDLYPGAVWWPLSLFKVRP